MQVLRVQERHRLASGWARFCAARAEMLEDLPFGSTPTALRPSDLLELEVGVGSFAATDFARIQMRPSIEAERGLVLKAHGEGGRLSYEQFVGKRELIAVLGARWAREIYRWFTEREDEQRELCRFELRGEFEVAIVRSGRETLLAALGVGCSDLQRIAAEQYLRNFVLDLVPNPLADRMRGCWTVGSFAVARPLRTPADSSGVASSSGGTWHHDFQRVAVKLQSADSEQASLDASQAAVCRNAGNAADSPLRLRAPTPRAALYALSAA